MMILHKRLKLVSQSVEVNQDALMSEKQTNVSAYLDWFMKLRINAMLILVDMETMAKMELIEVPEEEVIRMKLMTKLFIERPRLHHCKHSAHSCVVGCKERGGPYLR